MHDRVGESGAVHENPLLGVQLDPVWLPASLQALHDAHVYCSSVHGGGGSSAGGGGGGEVGGSPIFATKTSTGPPRLACKGDTVGKLEEAVLPAT